MLRFTERGAVATPETLQIRVSPEHSGAIAAGAPIARDGMTAAQVRENLVFFTTGQKVRGVPCRHLVLAGSRPAEPAGLADVVAFGRGLGITRVTVHLGAGDRATFLGSALAASTDDVAVGVRGASDVDDVAALREFVGEVVAVVPLDRDDPDGLSALCDRLIDARPARVVLTWPFAGAPPPRAQRAAALADAAVRRLDAGGLAVQVKGLPACAIEDPRRAGSSRNRWYVDVDHQLGAALLFFPEVLSFGKEEVCRFCAWDTRCDGAPRRWLEGGLCDPLRPLGPDGAPSQV